MLGPMVMFKGWLQLWRSCIRSCRAVCNNEDEGDDQHMEFLPDFYSCPLPTIMFKPCGNKMFLSFALRKADLLATPPLARSIILGLSSLIRLIDMFPPTNCPGKGPFASSAALPIYRPSLPAAS